jgi:hypothetical protein
MAGIDLSSFSIPGMTPDLQAKFDALPIPSDVATKLGSIAPADLYAIASRATDAATTAAPALAVAQTIAKGGKPSAQAVIAGVAAVAGMVNPIAGLAIGALGEGAIAVDAALGGLFDALGLYDHHVTVYNYVGLMRHPGDVFPGNLKAANAIDVSTSAKLDAFMAHGDAHHPEPSGVVANIGTLLGKAFFQQRTRAQANASFPGVSDAELASIYLPHTLFEQFFATLLIHDMQLWANALPFVPPRDLLAGALQVWNTTHAASSTVTFEPSDYTLHDGRDIEFSLISDVLSAKYGDPDGVQDAIPVTVNTGPAIAPAPPRTASALTGRTMASFVDYTPAAASSAASLAVTRLALAPPKSPAVDPGPKVTAAAMLSASATSTPSTAKAALTGLGIAAAVVAIAAKLFL